MKKFLTNCLCFIFLAERRAQLARSRSRQNIFHNTSQSPDVVREINFEQEASSELPSKPNRRARGRKGSSNKDKENVENGAIVHKKDIGGASTPSSGGGLSEAEELLQRLKAL